MDNPQLPQRFHNRVIEMGFGKIGDFKPSQLNHKIHPETQLTRLDAILQRFGIVDNIIVWRSEANNNEWTVFDGNGRQKLDSEQVWPVSYTDMTDSIAKALVLVFDDIAKQIEYDPVKEAALFSEFEFSGDDNPLDFYIQELAMERHDFNDLWGEDFEQPAPSFDQLGADEQPRLDERSPVFCPHCGENIHDEQKA